MPYAVASRFPSHLGFREMLMYMFNVSKAIRGFLKQHGPWCGPEVSVSVSSSEERLPCWYVIYPELSVHLADIFQLYLDSKVCIDPERKKWANLSSSQILLVDPVWMRFFVLKEAISTGDEEDLPQKFPRLVDKIIVWKVRKLISNPCSESGRAKGWV